MATRQIVRSEYKVLRFDVKGYWGGKMDEDEMETQLSEYGAEGWDLVKITPLLKDMGHTAILIATMTRPLAEQD